MRNRCDDGKDYLGRDLKVGQTVVKPLTAGRSAHVQIKKVTAIDEHGQVYLDGWHSPVHYSGRLVIIFESDDDIGLAYGMTA